MHAAGDKLPRLGDDRLETARAELATQIGDDAEAARVVASLGNLDIGGGSAGGEQAGRRFVVEIGRQQVRGALPVIAAETGLAVRADRLRGEN